MNDSSLGPLRNKYRPQTLDEVVGNDELILSIRSILEKPVEIRDHVFLFHGPHGCLRGDTEIYDPIEKITRSVYDRWKIGKPFHVFSMDSLNRNVVALALPPVQYPEAPMFRVKTPESVFGVTAGHRFRAHNGEYLSLMGLFGKQFSEILFQSNLGPCPTTQLQDEFHCSETKVNFRKGYPPFFHFYGEQLLALLNNVLKLFPSPNDVLGHILDCLHLDGQELEQGYNHLHQLFDLLSKNHSSYQEHHLYELVYWFYTKTYEYFLQRHQKSPQLPFESYLRDTFLQLSNHSLLKDFLVHKDEDFSQVTSHKPLSALQSPFLPNMTTTITTTIKQITEISKEVFYDFHVPTYNNYWAGGLYHHNCGKTTIVRILRKMLQCHDIDFKERNAANTRGIEAIREDASGCAYGPMGKGGKTRVYFYDEAHQITGAASEALLKVTEDGAPPHVYFFFATTNPEKLTSTLKDRCAIYNVRKLNRQEMLALLKRIITGEGKEVLPEVIREIIRFADGTPRTALTLLSQIIGLESKEDALEVIQRFSTGGVTLDLCRAIHGPEGWDIVAKILKGIDEDAEQVRLGVLGYFREALLNNGNEKTARIMYEFSQPLDRNGKSGLVLACYAAKVLTKG